MVDGLIDPVSLPKLVAGDVAVFNQLNPDPRHQVIVAEVKLALVRNFSLPRCEETNYKVDIGKNL
jgi:hypothetical protein